MTFDADDLPTDPEALRALLIAERTRHAQEIARIAGERDRLRAIIHELQRHRFGRRSERLDPDQLALALEDVEQTVAAVEAAADRTATPGQARARRKINRGALPAHLPRIETVVDVADPTCPCCAGKMHKIGEDVAERLDVVPAQFRVLVVRRPKYACRSCTGTVVQAPAPPRLIEGGLPTEALVAHVIVAKYADHLPLYRQAQIYARQGIGLDRSTLADWVGRGAWWLRPLHARLLDELRASPKLFADETTAPVLDPGRGPDQDRPALGLCARRSTVERTGAAGGRLCLRARPQGGAPGRPSPGLPGHPAGRRLCRLSRARGSRPGPAGLLLEPCATALLRDRCGRLGADRRRGPRTDRRALCDRGRDPWQIGR